jgi:glycosyltransferase involved in cell wall biosynthesis
VPVYNGENFVEEAIESILNQSFEDLELIISDDGSTDSTEDICRAFTARDERVRYFRNPENIGPGPNYRRALGLTRAPYVKLAAHDDVCLPTFIETCVSVLDRDPTVVLAHTAAASIDEAGEVISVWEPNRALAADDAETRFRAALDIGDEIYLIWGVARAEVMRRIPPIGAYVGHDRPWLTALALHGRIDVSPEVLFHQREHPQRSVHTYDWRRPREAIAWHDRDRAGKLTFPNWRLLGEHARAVLRAPVNVGVKNRCLQELAHWATDNRQALRWDVAMAAERLPIAGEQLMGIFSQAAMAVRRRVPDGGAFILIDDATLEIDIFGHRTVIPMMEKNGTYWGPPADDQSAIVELERLRQQGALLVVIAANCYWWLDHYVEFAEHLERYAPIYESTDFVIRDLRDPLHQQGRLGSTRP